MHARIIRGIVAALLGAWLPLAAGAAAIDRTTIEPATGGSERIIFHADSPLAVQKSFTLSNPDRVVVDVPQVRATGVALPPNYQGRLVRNIRFGQFDASTSRLVIDMAIPAKIVRVGPEGGNRLVVEVAPSEALPAPTSHAPISPFTPIDTPDAVPVETVVEKPLVVIDPGHGGQDPGAISKRNKREKDVTLAMAKMVKEGLLRTGRYRVVMTRETDIYIPLQGRVDIARRAGGDVFLSLHADSHPKAQARGLSVYTLSETASDDEAEALAVRENKSDIIAGLDLGTADEDVASILIDLTQRETMNKSAVLADTIVANLHPKISKLSSTHRFAGFRVLKAPDIPSVLIELGFLSNAQDEQLLHSKEYQDLVVASLVKALDRYTAK